MKETKRTFRAVGDHEYFGGDTSKMLSSFGYKEVASYKTADFIVLVGGADVHPSLYNEEFNGAQADSRSLQRDLKEKEIFEFAYASRKPILGICRGFQFLGVMNGNKLHQHVIGHTSNYGHHPVYSAEYLEPKFYVNSYHHQQVNLDGPYSVRRCLWADLRGTEIESCVWPKTLSAGVQWHPEWLTQAYPCRGYFAELVEYLFAQKFVEDVNNENGQDSS